MQLILLLADVMQLYGKVEASKLSVNWLSQLFMASLSIDLMLWMCWQHKQRQTVS